MSAKMEFKDSLKRQLQELELKYREAKEKDMPFSTLKEIKLQISEIMQMILTDENPKKFYGNPLLID